MKKFRLIFLSAFVTMLFGISGHAMATDDPEGGPTGDGDTGCKLPPWMCGSDDDNPEKSDF